MKNKSASHTAPGFIKSLFLGISINALAFIVFAFIIASVAYGTDDPTAMTALLSITAFVLSGAIGTIINVRLFKNGKSSLPYFCTAGSLAIFLIISLIAGGSLSVGHIISAACFALIAVLSALAAKNKKSARRKRRKRS